MKTIVFLILALVFTVGLSQAQRNVSKYQKFQNMKTGGVILAVAGGILTVVGVSVLSSSSVTQTNQSGQTQFDSKFTTSVYLISGGIQMVGGGIVLAVIGGKKARKYGSKLSMNLNLSSVNPPQVGLKLRF